MKVIIIEDEQLIAENLKSCIIKCRSNYEIIAILSSVESAIDYLKKNGASSCLIFSDVALGDGTCFDIFSKAKINGPIVFCTAYDKYAIDAFNTNGIDYILKPLHIKRVEQAILKFEQLAFNLPVQNEKLRQISSQFIEPKIFLVNYRDKILPFDEHTIAAFHIDAGIVYLIDLKNNSYSITKSLDEIETEVGSNYYRANRQVIINRMAIKEIIRTDSRKLIVLLKVPLKEDITISKEKISSFLNWFKQSQT